MLQCQAISGRAAGPTMGQGLAGPSPLRPSLMFQQQQLEEKQQQDPPTPASPSHVSQDAQSQLLGTTSQDLLSLQSPSEQAQPLEDPEGELREQERAESGTENREGEGLASKSVY